MNKPILTALIHLAYLCPCFSQPSPGKDSVIPAIVTKWVSTSPAVIRVYNDHSPKPLTALTLQWEMISGGRQLQKGSIPLLPIAPLHSAVFHLPLRPAASPKDEQFVNIRYILKKADSLLPAGSLIADAQLLLRPGLPADCSVHPDGALTFNDDNNLFTISSPQCNLQFSKQTGWLLHYNVNGNSLLDEDSGFKSDIAPEPRLQLFSTSTSTDLAIVNADYTLPECLSLLHIRYTVNAHGEMQIAQSLEPDTMQIEQNLQTTQNPQTALNPQTTQNPQTVQDTVHTAAALSRFGMQWTLPAGLDSITWYGAGPFIGIYKKPVPTDPARPFTGLRWWKLTNREGQGIMITADSALLTIAASRIPAHAATQLNISSASLPIPFKNYHYFYKVSPL